MNDRKKPTKEDVERVSRIMRISGLAILLLAALCLFAPSLVMEYISLDEETTFLFGVVFAFMGTIEIAIMPKILQKQIEK